MFSSLVVMLAALAAVQARPQLLFPQSSSSGNSQSGITTGQSVDQFGNLNTIKQSQAATGGNTQGPGASNFGSAFTQEGSQSGLFGQSNTANTGAQSVQNTGGRFPSIGGGFGNFGGGFGNLGGGFGNIGGFPQVGGQASGEAGSSLTTGETVSAGGDRSRITQLGSSAGGSASNGGDSFNTAQGSTSGQSGLLGSFENSNLNSQSIQTSGR